MPSIEDSIKSKINLTGYSAYTPEKSPTIESRNDNRRGIFLRCPVPPIGAISVDNLDQFNMNGAIPQYRVFQGK
jgi:hypothetical protein